MLWLSSLVRCFVIGVSEFFGLNLFLVGWLRCDVIIMVVLVLSVVWMVGMDVCMWVFLVMLL